MSLRQEINKALEAIGLAHGVNIKAGNAGFSEAQIKFQLIVTHDDPSGMSSPEALAYRQYAKAFGYNPDVLGKEVTYNGKTYRILGLLARGEKYPILAEKAGGIRVKLTDDLVKVQEEVPHGA